jgi:hypothetical protein
MEVFLTLIRRDYGGYMPQRVVRETVLVFCEGEREQVFVRHLRHLYCCGRIGTTSPSVTVRKGRGGSADGLVNDATRAPGAYKRRLVKLDADRPPEELERAQGLANTANIMLCISEPCLEALLMKILEPDTYFSGWTTKRFKRTFERKYIPEAKRSIPLCYRPLFTKEILEEARQRIPELDSLLDFIVNG